MRKIKLIALDMDGTLLNDDGVVTETTKEVIQQALEQNIQVMLCTGRPLSMCISFAKELNLTADIVTVNGAEIYTADGVLIEQHVIDHHKMEKMWQIGKKRDLHMWLVTTDNVYYTGGIPDDFSKHIWLKIGYGNLSTDNKVYVTEKLKEIQSIMISNSSPHNIEVNGEGVSKAQALRSICERTGIGMDQVMAIGDSLNDFHMIKEAGIGIAVENAQNPILEIADYIVPSNNQDGVARAIEWYGL